MTSRPPFLVRPTRVLILMGGLGVLLVGLHVGTAWRTLDGLGVRAAWASSPAAPPPTIRHESSAAEASPAAPSSNAAPQPPEAPQAPAAAPDDPSTVMDLMRELADKRTKLEQRAKTLDEREALLRVAEERMAQKVTEMETLRGQVQGMLSQLSSGQQAQIENLVKIYEKMKPKEAARIFETLDMPILLSVMQRMKPATAASIMADMPPEKAKDLTQALTKRED